MARVNCATRRCADFVQCFDIIIAKVAVMSSVEVLGYPALRDFLVGCSDQAVFLLLLLPLLLLLLLLSCSNWSSVRASAVSTGWNRSLQLPSFLLPSLLVPLAQVPPPRLLIFLLDIRSPRRLRLVMPRANPLLRSKSHCASLSFSVLLTLSSGSLSYTHVRAACAALKAASAALPIEARMSPLLQIPS